MTDQQDSTVMRAPDAEALLRIWEDGDRTDATRRALSLLGAAMPEAASVLAAESIGRRDSQLLALYEALFGSCLETVAPCPNCGELLESTFRTDDIRVPQPAYQALAKHSLRVASYRIEYRLPNSQDLLQALAAAGSGDSESAKAIVLARCVTSVRQGRSVLESAALPANVVEILVADMADRDPGADVRVGLQCPNCAHVWSANFDIVTYFWSALSDWAQRTLADVHLLASTYGWSERDILGLNPTRRRQYVNMVCS